MSAIDDAEAKARWLAGSGTPSWGANEVDEAAELISKLKIEAGNLHARGTQLDAVVAELEAELKVHQRMAAAASMMGGTRDSSDDVQANNRGGQTAEGMAHSCLDDGCPVNTVSDLIAELKEITASHTRSATEQHYIDQLIGSLNTSLDHAGATQHTTGTKFGGM